MLNADEDALICDLAETYHIFNYRELPPTFVATLAVGLGEDSRIKNKMNGNNVGLTYIFLASILDHLKTLLWLNSDDGSKGVNRPKSILSILLEGDSGTDGNVLSFDSAEEYEKYRQSILQKGGR